MDDLRRTKTTPPLWRGTERKDEIAGKTEILKGVIPKDFEQILNDICKTLVGRGLSFRQAEVLLDIARERLKDARI